ncbi:MAG: 16S rRNA (cytidine(1402)-2'-O)-methyltransferase, partial [Lachnospiraceae bacterium]|nr:16S rRNA (cytidine(1402)-2'-O)-methyltransferase [Candidatus Equihabitans merdae]
HLLNHYDVHTPLTSYHKYNEVEKTPYLIDQLLLGKNIALISDAGMPLISDPGSVLIRSCHENGITATTVPGANAALTALSLSGADTRRFIFEGFLPQDNKEKAAVLDSLVNETRTTVFYEAPHRLKKTLEALYKALGDRPIALCRELTKRFEEVDVTTLSQAIAETDTKEPRGEYVLVLWGKDPEELKAETRASWEAMTIAEHVAHYEAQGLDHKAAMKQAAADRGVSKRDIYQALLDK